MTTQVYYRKWRPHRLTDLVGQDHVVHTLRQALILRRLAHAYLLCGPRGTGKTSTARIIAMAVNCLNPDTNGEPDNTCHLCTSVLENRSLDLIEIDAASNRGIDEIRSLREKAHYAPTESNYKVYILDEAHMLTPAAADALLKTLEEPPRHVIFVLATTDPHKLPPTITSRCQRFDFRRIPPSAITERLADIANSDGISIETTALDTIAKNATGSLRDAENILEQAVTSFSNEITQEQIFQLLGISGDDRARLLVRYMLQKNTSKALSLINDIVNEGLDIRQFHRLVLEETRELLLLKSNATEILNQSKEILEEQSVIIESVSLERLLRLVKLLGSVRFGYDTLGTLPLELVVVELNLNDSYRKTSSTPEEKEDATSLVPPSNLESTHPQVSPEGKDPNEQISEIESPSEQQTIVSPTLSPVHTKTQTVTDTLEGKYSAKESRDGSWDELIRVLSRTKGRRFNLGALLRACNYHELKENTLTMEFTHRSSMERIREEMDYPESRRAFLEATTNIMGTSPSLTLAFKTTAEIHDKHPKSESALVTAAMNMGGKILNTDETIKKDRINSLKEPDNE